MAFYKPLCHLAVQTVGLLVARVIVKPENEYKVDEVNQVLSDFCKKRKSSSVLLKKLLRFFLYQALSPKPRALKP